MNLSIGRLECIHNTAACFSQSEWAKRQRASDSAQGEAVVQTPHLCYAIRHIDQIWYTVGGDRVWILVGGNHSRPPWRLGTTWHFQLFSSGNGNIKTWFTHSPSVKSHPRNSKKLSTLCFCLDSVQVPDHHPLLCPHHVPSTCAGGSNQVWLILLVLWCF